MSTVSAGGAPDAFAADSAAWVRDPWRQVVLDLCRAPAFSVGAPFRARARQPEPARCWPPGARQQTSGNGTVTVVERLADYAFALSWSDSTRCHYREQVWKRALAKKAGICALSGASIRKGDAVFRPEDRRYRDPLNAGAMILAASLDRWDANADPQ
ncbi:DUF3331 domain-containing protein [Paraburkholderia sp. MMS20-SJTR3]|uniref:DUF3331 domain-containing protein n=1 Tax=Paraburkholderia sejongensis TaxID=2886946 RepID=A0ABS8K224_9BURK|nr:DUF3331 domain-containing protein [Paraburkholderia sp. MMS20-SJTR3]MCC8395953.1 DUF3331 domain-containing protein [Paraburkholderia sp. MMS20-SJTR3]